MRGLIARIARRLRRDVLRLAGHAAPKPVSMLYVVPRSAEPGVQLPPGASIGYADAATVRAAPERYASSASNAIVSLAHEHRCLVLTISGELAYYMWVADAGPIRPLYPDGALPPDALWAYGGGTLPPFRGQGLHGASLRWLAAQGRAIAVQTTSGNGTAQRSFVRAGAQFVGTHAIFD